MSEILTTTNYLNYLEAFLSEQRNLKIQSVVKQRTKYLTVVAEDVFQLHNTSAVLRSCDVFGIQNLHIIEQKYGKNIDTEIALGAQKWVDIFRYNSPQTCLHSLKKKGYRIIVTSPHHEAFTTDTLDISTPFAVFFGNEKEGVSSDIMDAADGFLHIPMCGFTESLNISVAAAIVMQNLTKRIKSSNVSWQLTEDETLKTKIQWMETSIRSLRSIQKNYLEKFEGD
ncbi:MAG: TrmH family RNA methyltransferase [Flavobacterium sp.]